MDHDQPPHPLPDHVLFSLTETSVGMMDDKIEEHILLLENKRTTL